MAASVVQLSILFHFRDEEPVLFMPSRDSGINAIESLMKRKGAFDYILLETTGLADPGNLVPIFWVDEGLGSSVYLDGIVTLVDAKNILHCLDAPKAETHPNNEVPGSYDSSVTIAHLQISYADVIIINKSDLVSEQELIYVKEWIQVINTLAELHITSRSQVPQLEGFILDIHAYDDIKSLDIMHRTHSQIDSVINTPSSCTSILTSRQTITTIAFSIPLLDPRQVFRVDEWLQSVLWEAVLPNSGMENTNNQNTQKYEVHRLKAILILRNQTVKIVQGVRDIFEIIDAPIDSSHSNRGNENKEGKFVIIGRGIKDIPFQQSILDWISFS